MQDHDVSSSMNMDDTLRCGFVAIVGRPNVGKSTLMNRILGQKISITSRRPQTTRHQVMGVKTEDGVQAVYVDTPGMHVMKKRSQPRDQPVHESGGYAGIARC